MLFIAQKYQRMGNTDRLQMDEALVARRWRAGLLINVKAFDFEWIQRINAVARTKDMRSSIRTNHFAFRNKICKWTK